MKTTYKLFIFSFAILALSIIEFAQTPPEQLSQMVEHLQKKPDDKALREKIIKLGAEMKPAPEIPEDARRLFIKANTAIKKASSPDDYASAIKQYREALIIAPWWGDAYYNLATALELHQEYEAGIQSLKWYLMTSPADARAAKDHIYALEELQDKKVAEDKVKAEADKIKANSPPDFKGIWRQSFSTPGMNGFPPGKYNSAFRVIDSRTIYHSYNLEDGSPPIEQFSNQATDIKQGGRELSFRVRTPGVSGSINYSLTLSDDGTQMKGFWSFTQDDTSRGLGLFAQLGRVAVLFIRD